jgi:hypothetical protein
MTALRFMFGPGGERLACFSTSRVSTSDGGSQDSHWANRPRLRTGVVPRGSPNPGSAHTLSHDSCVCA